MPSKRKAEQGTVLQWLFDRGEETASQLLHEVLGRPGLTDQVSKLAGRATRGQGRVDKNLEAILHLLNLPTRSDLHKLQTKIDHLQGSLVNLNMKLDRLLAAQAQARRVPAPDRSEPGGDASPP